MRCPRLDEIVLQFGYTAFVLGDQFVQCFGIRSEALGVVHFLGPFDLLCHKVIVLLFEGGIFVLELLASLGDRLEFCKGGSGIVQLVAFLLAELIHRAVRFPLNHRKLTSQPFPLALDRLELFSKLVFDVYVVHHELVGLVIGCDRLVEEGG